MGNMWKSNFWLKKWQVSKYRDDAKAVKWTNAIITLPQMSSLVVFNIKQWLSIFNCKLCTWSHSSKHDCISWGFAKKICRQSNCYSHLFTVLCHAQATYVWCFPLSLRKIFKSLIWSFLLQYPQVCLYFVLASNSTIKDAKRFSNLSTGLMGKVY